MLGKISEVENTLVCYLAGKSLPVSILKRQTGATIVWDSTDLFSRRCKWRCVKVLSLKHDEGLNILKQLGGVDWV